MGALKIAGLILLSLFCLALLIVILVLAVPVRYRISASGGSSEGYAIPETAISGNLSASWLLHLVTACGKAFPADNKVHASFTVRAAGIRITEKDLILPEEKKGGDPEKPGEEGQKKSVGMDEIRPLLEEPEIKKHTGGILKSILPDKGKAKLYYGAGDPYKTAEFLCVAAFFYPMYARVLEIIPDMNGKSLYFEGDVSGKIRIGRAAWHGLMIYKNKKVQLLIKTRKGEVDNG